MDIVFLKELRIDTVIGIYQWERQIRQTVEGPLPELVANLVSLTENADRTFVHADQTLLQSRSNIINATQDLEEAMQNFREMTELVRDNPALLIRGGSRADGSN